MKINISYSLEVSDEYRRAILHYYGYDRGLANRQQIIEWFKEYGTQMDDDLRHGHGDCCWGDEEDEE